MSIDLMPNRFIHGEVTLAPREAALVNRRDAVLGASYRLNYRNPVHFVRGEGMYLYDPDGVRYLDFYNNVPSLGHSRPEVVEAVARQSSMLNINPRYLDTHLVDYAERLVATFPKSMGRVVFTCTGSESNDLALRMARFVTGGDGVIVTEYAYHGTSAAAAAISPNLGSAIPLGPYVRTVRLPGVHGISDSDSAAFFRSEVEGALADLIRHGIKPAAFIADSIFSSDGVYTDPAGFLSGAIKSVRNVGAVYIADEVQPGFGRMGETMWGFARHNVIPDIASLGKPMGNGYPVGAVVGRDAIVDEFGKAARYSNTFAGNTVAIAAASAVLDVIEHDGILDNARRTGASLLNELRRISKKDNRLSEVRGTGLFYGASIGTDEHTKDERRQLSREVVNGLRDEAVLISTTGANEDVLKIRPPIICGDEHVTMFIEALERVLDRIK